MLFLYKKKLWTEICETRQIFKWDLIKFCEIFTKITLKLPQNSQKPLLQCMMFVINTTKCDVCLFLHKMCCKIVWKFCQIWKSYGNWLPDVPNSVKFYLTVWDMACMQIRLLLGAVWSGIRLLLGAVWSGSTLFAIPSASFARMTL